MKYSDTPGVDLLIEIIELARNIPYNGKILDKYGEPTERDKVLIEIAESIIYKGQKLLAVIEPSEMNISNAKEEGCYCTRYTCKCG